MIQVIEKVSLILEYLSRNRGHEVSLSEIADTLHINRATCANIMKSLKELNLVQQADYRGGYILGSQIYNLAGMKTESTSLKARLKPIIDSLNRDINENVMLAVIKGGHRELIYTVKGNHRIEANTIQTMGIWPATTAKVIIAYYSKPKLNELIRMIGMPGEEWPEIKNREDLDRALADIRTDGFKTVILDHYACIVAPVFADGEIVASLGTYLPDIRLDGKREMLERKLVETAKRCSAVLQ